MLQWRGYELAAVVVGVVRALQVRFRLGCAAVARLYQLAIDDI